MDMWADHCKATVPCACVYLFVFVGARHLWTLTDVGINAETESTEILYKMTWNVLSRVLKRKFKKMHPLASLCMSVGVWQLQNHWAIFYGIGTEKFY
jgi:hypothetical protein